MEKQYRVVIIGFSHMHINDVAAHFYENPRTDLVAGADTIPLVPELKEGTFTRKWNLEFCRTNFKIPKIYEDYREMLDQEKPDLAVITCENAQHLEVMYECAVRGVNVSIEKPMAADLSMAMEMIRISNTYGVKMFVNWPVTWRPELHLMKDLLDEGKIGRILEFKIRVSHTGPLGDGAKHPGVKITAEPMTNEEKARTWWYQSKCGGGAILLTGYAEFEYAQKALQLGAKSYILKPIDEEELVKTLIEAREEILQRRKENFHNKYFSISMEQVITKLVYGAVDEEFIDAANAVYGFQLPWKRYQLVLLEQTKNQETDEKVLDLLKDFTKNNIGFVFSLNNHFVVLTKDVIFEQGKMRLLEDLNGKLRKLPGYTQPMVVSRPLKELEQINQAYYAASYFIEHQFIFPYEEIVLIDEVGNPYAQGKISNANQREQLDYRKIAEGLCVAVCGNDLTGISSLLENLGNKCVESGYDLEQIRIRYVSTYVSVMYLLKIQSEEIFKQEGMVDVVILQISRLSHLQSINSFFLDKLSQIAQKLNSNQQGNVIRKMKEYIEANYNSDLTLKNLSKIFHYNVAYFGKLFKSNTGMSYNDYVTSVRMEKAKELLNQGEKVYKVANQVGYQDLDYFNMKFKKYFNALPSDFHKDNNK